MLIGELSRQTGLSKDTIRFYEKNRLIQSSERKAGSRIYREYSASTVERLSMIRQGKVLGFTLSEIRELAEAWEGGTLSQDQQIEAIRNKLSEIRQKMSQLQDMENYLSIKLNKLTTA